ncbi:hypothetical protein [Hymenobacter weizhouensis]|uniref:hypothetical protein n=1 Tax=Hymenobacter sp. YIM 151500-1 TaxID=2987689 RepID=UPI00222732F7|nr:hypothetical protein [Hymenobacter sp. YIM 151500-1]UYZ65279.1 hypothetical protein OIS53_20025 [Hymenobacter sp. YIM 151500-1]
MGKFFTKQVCVYLDQFAVSHCADPNSSEDWQQLRTIIEQGVANKTLVVPYSNEHLLESSARDAERAQTQDAFLFRLSGGLSLMSEGDVTARLLLNHARKQAPSRSSFCQKVPVMGFALQDGFQQFSAIKRGFNIMIEEAAVAVNHTRQLTAQGPRPNEALRRTALFLKEEYYTKELLSQLKKFARYGFLERKTAVFPSQTIPLWSDAVMVLLINRLGMTQREARKIKETIEKHGLRVAAAPLFIRARLEAAMALKHQRETPNDYMDVQRMAVALPFADIVLTDKSKCFDIKEYALHTLFDTEVYSGSREDLKQFAVRLRKIVEA